jgi:hypothetical protein
MLWVCMLYNTDRASAIKGTLGLILAQRQRQLWPSHASHSALIYIRSWPPRIYCTACDTGYHTPSIGTEEITSVIDE